MPVNPTPQPETSPVDIYDGLAHLDASVPVQGTFPVSLVHSLWTYYRKSAGAHIAASPEKTPAKYLIGFLQHLCKLKLIPKDVVDDIPELRSIDPFDDAFICYSLAGAFDALQHRAMIKTTGHAASPRYQADPFFVPAAFKNGAPALAKYPGKWHVSSTLDPIHACISDITYPTEGHPRTVVTLPDGVSVHQHVVPDGNPNYVFHYDNAAIALDSLRACQKYYLGHPVPFNAMIASLTLNPRRAGDAISISASGLYPVTEGFTVSDSCYTAPILCPYYMIMRLPTDADHPTVSELPRASSSVLISGEITYSRMTDEVFYDGVSELLTGTPLPGTKFIFIADPARLDAHRNELQKYATAPNPNKEYSFCGGRTPYVCMYACEFRDGKLTPATSFWSAGDTRFLCMLATESKSDNLISMVDKIVERIK